MTMFVFRDRPSALLRVHIYPSKGGVRPEHVCTRYTVSSSLGRGSGAADAGLPVPVVWICFLFLILIFWKGHLMKPCGCQRSDSYSCNLRAACKREWLIELFLLRLNYGSLK